MPSHSNNTPAQLRKRLAEVMAELAKKCPDLYEDMQLLQKLIEVAEHGSEPLFAKVRGTVGAIELCFDLHGAWMTKDAIVESILKGGYPIPPKSARGLINDALNYHVGTGRIARKDDLFGKPSWLKRKSAK